MGILSNIKRNMDVEDNGHVLGKRDDNMGIYTNLMMVIITYRQCLFIAVSRLLCVYTCQHMKYEDSGVYDRHLTMHVTAPAL